MYKRDEVGRGCGMRGRVGAGTGSTGRPLRGPSEGDTLGVRFRGGRLVSRNAVPNPSTGTVFRSLSNRAGRVDGVDDPEAPSSPGIYLK